MRSSRLSRAAKAHCLLTKTYNTPALGNLVDPVEELIFISLSRQTHEVNTARAWRAIVESGGVSGIRAMSVSQLEALIRPSGLSWQKARWIKGALEAIESRFGQASLDALQVNRAGFSGGSIP